MTPHITHYDVLGVPQNATAHEVRIAWRKACKIHHPDRAGGSEAAQSAINEAYRVLSDDKLRQEYDDLGALVSKPLEVRGREAMLQAFHVSLLQLDTTLMPLSAAREKLLSERMQLSTQLQECESRIHRVSGQRDSIKVKRKKKVTKAEAAEQPENFLRGTVDQILALLGNDRARMTDRAEVLDEALRQLDDYTMMEATATINYVTGFPGSSTPTGGFGTWR